MVTIVDYGMGNLNSVCRKLSKIGIKSIISPKPIDMLEADHIILPGVGHFGKAVENLKERGLWDALDEAVLNKKTPILGICLGLQLMAKNSEEGQVEGFGWFDAEVKRFDVANKLKHKIPHMGWNTLKIKKSNSLLDGVPDSSEFYFVHSFHIKCNSPELILSETKYEYDFPSVLGDKHIYGVQFHPEKSHNNGERILYNFINKY